MKKNFLIYAFIMAIFLFNLSAQDIKYTIVVSSLKSSQSAEKMVDELAKKQFAAFIYKAYTSSGEMNRVCVGSFLDKNQAEKTQKQLFAKGYSNTWITEISEKPKIQASKKNNSKNDIIEDKALEDELNSELETEAMSEDSFAKPKNIVKKEVKKEVKKTVINEPVKKVIPMPPDVDKLPLALPKEITVVQKSNENDTKVVKEPEVTKTTYIVSTLKTGTIEKAPEEGIIPESTTKNYDEITISATAKPNNASETIIYSEKIPIISNENKKIVKSENIDIFAENNDSLEIMNQNNKIKPLNKPEPIKIIHNEKEIIINTNEVSKPQDKLVIPTNEMKSSEPEYKQIGSVQSIKETNPQMSNLIPGTNLTFEQFHIDIKKIFYALEKYSMASGTLLNEYIDPNTGTYIRYREKGGNKPSYEKMLKPKDIYKNSQVQSKVLQFFEDLGKVRRQQAVIEAIPSYDCAMKKVPGLNIYLSGVMQDNKFYNETINYFNSKGIELTEEEMNSIKSANTSINAAFAIGSAELIKTVFFAIEGNKIYLKYIDMYDKCE